MPELYAAKILGIYYGQVTDLSPALLSEGIGDALTSSEAENYPRTASPAKPTT